MMKQHPFWGSLSPIGGLTGAGILVMASARLAWSITIAGALVWVYGLTAFTFVLLSELPGKNKFPAEGRSLIFTCLASFFGSVYLLLLWFLSPLAAMEVFFPLMLVPLFCSGSGICERITASVEVSRPDVSAFVSEAALQAITLGMLLIIFAVIREPLAYCSLSLPGSSRGMISVNLYTGSFFHAKIFASSAGALLLLGYFTGVYQFTRTIFAPGEIEK
jgi:hypothetical protein